MSKRHGVVLKFKPGVTPAQIAQALNSFKDLIEVPQAGQEAVYLGEGKNKTVKYKTVPFTWRHMVHEYDDEHGGPVWYIP